MLQNCHVPYILGARVNFLSLEVSFDFLKLWQPNRKADKIQIWQSPVLHYPIPSAQNSGTHQNPIQSSSFLPECGTLTSRAPPEPLKEEQILLPACRVPDLDSEEIKRISEQNAERHSCQGLQRIGKDTAIV